jgi:hypothetical protein
VLAVGGGAGAVGLVAQPPSNAITTATTQAMRNDMGAMAIQQRGVECGANL